MSRSTALALVLFSLVGTGCAAGRTATGLPPLGRFLNLAP